MFTQPGSSLFLTITEGSGGINYMRDTLSFIAGDDCCVIPESSSRKHKSQAVEPLLMAAVEAYDSLALRRCQSASATSIAAVPP